LELDWVRGGGSGSEKAAKEGTGLELELCTWGVGGAIRGSGCFWMAEQLGSLSTSPPCRGLKKRASSSACLRASTR
jgi:hypothetical protein